MQTDPRRVVIIGVGGVGTFLAEGIVRILEFSAPGSLLILVDGDTFEPKNAERQTFSTLGNKSEVKASDLAPLFPGTYIAANPRWVVETIEDTDATMTDSHITASTLLEENDIVFCVVDNFAARKVTFDAAKNFNDIDVFTGGNDESYFGNVYHYARRAGKDITDHPVEWHPEYQSPPDRNPGSLSCEERARLEGGTQFVCTNMAVAAWLLGRLHILLSGHDIIKASEIYFDLREGLSQPFPRDAAIVAPAKESADVKV